MTSEPKSRGTYSVTINPSFVEDIDALVRTGLFRSRSHAFEEGLRLLLELHRDRLEKVESSAA